MAWLIRLAKLPDILGGGLNIASGSVTVESGNYGGNFDLYDPGLPIQGTVKLVIDLDSNPPAGRIYYASDTAWYYVDLTYQAPSFSFGGGR